MPAFLEVKAELFVDEMASKKTWWDSGAVKRGRL